MISQRDLQKELWWRWGRPEFKAEWDGRDGNGGRGSQRFWEYLWATEQLSVFARSMPESFADIGGGENMFFVDLLRARTEYTSIVVDPLVNRDGDLNIAMSLKDFVKSSPHKLIFGAITCISVLEHVEDKAEFCANLDEMAGPIILTFELGEGCVTKQEMYKCLDQFENHHMAKMELCPIWADNSSITGWRPMGMVLL